MGRAAWARSADLVARWFGIEGKGTTRLGRARIPFKGARIETRTVMRSSAITKAELTKPQGLPFLPAERWLSVLISRRQPKTVALIMDAELAESVCRHLSRTWAFDEDSGSGPSSDSPVFVGGTD